MIAILEDVGVVVEHLMSDQEDVNNEGESVLYSPLI
jgi:hypothetical protein